VSAAARAPQPAGSALLEVSGLVRSFGGVQAVSDATFLVRPGTITGLIGPNGAGKSTVIDLISGRTRPDRGSVRFEGLDITNRPPHEVSRCGIIRTFQKANVFGRLTVLENLLLGARPWHGERLLQALWRRASWTSSEAELVQRAFEILARFGLERLANDYAGALSGGQKRLVELMRALMAEPKMLLLDEPMAGVNPTLALSISEHLEELRGEGMTMLMVEHELRWVDRLCDPVVVMARGGVLAEGSMAQLQENQDVVDAYLGG
jgi:ABC-type branched-subunit amino acid transport system ATPase component